MSANFRMIYYAGFVFTMMQRRNNCTESCK